MQHPPLASSGCHGLFHAWSRGRATFTSRLFAPLRLPRVFKPRLLVRSWADGPRRRAGGVRGVRGCGVVALRWTIPETEELMQHEVELGELD
ncbi:uncharacterized protein LOC144477212 isoform X3 [Augochlora pura]